MEGPKWKQEKGNTGKTVRFRVASANSGRVLTEVFKDETAWFASGMDSVGSDCTGGSEAEQGGPPPTSEANSHLNGLVVAKDESGCEPDDLLLYASAKREMLFSNKRINICSKNGTVRGVRNKVSAGQVLFNNLSNMYPNEGLSKIIYSGEKLILPLFFSPLTVPFITRKEDPGKSSGQFGSGRHQDSSLS